MKKIEAIIHAKNEESVIDALRKLDFGGMSLFIGKGVEGDHERSNQV